MTTATSTRKRTSASPRHVGCKALPVAAMIAACLVLVLPITVFATDHSNGSTGPVPGRFIVKLAPAAKLTSASAAVADIGTLRPLSRLRLNRPLPGGDFWERTMLVTAKDARVTADDIADRIGRNAVEYVEPDYWLEFFDYPTEPLFEQQWYLHNTGQTFQAVDRLPGDFNDTLITRQGVPGVDLGFDSLYINQPAEATRVVVAIVDSGVDTGHPELAGQFWQNPDEIPGNGIDDDHNGLVDDTLGYDVSGDFLTLEQPEGDNDPTDSVGHGTHVAGLVGSAENGMGVVGSAPGAAIMAVKIRPNATTAVGAAGIVYAVNSGADIINVSWGTPYESRVLEDAILFARANDVLVCIASGNTGNNERYYPASYDSAFTVAACNAEGYLTYFTTWGAHIDVAAPGQDIISLRADGTDVYDAISEPGVHIIGPDSLYYLASGTSMSTPLVCGTAARLLAVRPDLTVTQLEDILRNGARDMIDPFNVGDSLPGPDTVSGYGMVDASASLALVPAGGIFVVEPIAGNRYEGQIAVRATAVGSYGGGWHLSYATADAPGTWLPLDSGSSLPADSVLKVFAPPGMRGIVTLRVTDDAGIHQLVTCRLVVGSDLALTSPLADSSYTYNVPIAGSAYGETFDSVVVSYRFESSSRQRVFGGTGEFFDTLIYSWNASGIDLGQYTIYLDGYFDGSGTVTDSVTIELASAFAAGWPRSLSGRGGLSATVADLEGDGSREIIVGTTYGLNVFGADGQPFDGYPLLPGESVRGVPAAYDVDNDGEREIIFNTESGLHVVNGDGSYVDGWPVSCGTGVAGFGLPNATITQLNIFEDSAIVLLNRSGQILAYDFDGDSYFYSLEGWFASFYERPSGSYYFGGDMVSAADLDGDGRREVIVGFSATSPFGGIGVFDARTGQPAFGRPLPHVLVCNTLFGTVLADITGDGHPEIIAVGTDTTSVPTLWAITEGTSMVPGFPIAMPDARGWRGNYPTVADLNLDGSREVLCSFFGYDLGALYAFKSDGSAYLTIEDRPFGEVYYAATTFSAPVVADLTGDPHPEISMRCGYIFPSTGRETIHILDYTFAPIPGWPVQTPAPSDQVFSTPQAPLVDDIDNDGLVEMVLVSEDANVYAWDFDAPVSETNAAGRLFFDERNSSLLPGVGLPTDVEDNAGDAENNLPESFVLSQNYPNPFNPTTQIDFALPTRSHVQVDVFNVLGQQVQTLLDERLPAGWHTISFDATGLATGVYLYRLRSDTYTETRKMLLVK